MDRYIFFSLSMSLALEILSQKHHSPPFSEKDLCPHIFEIPACVPEMERLPVLWPCHSRHVNFNKKLSLRSLHLALGGYHFQRAAGTMTYKTNSASCFLSCLIPIHSTCSWMG